MFNSSRLHTKFIAISASGHHMSQSDDDNRIMNLNLPRWMSSSSFQLSWTFLQLTSLFWWFAKSCSADDWCLSYISTAIPRVRPAAPNSFYLRSANVRAMKIRRNFEWVLRFTSRFLYSLDNSSQSFNTSSIADIIFTLIYMKLENYELTTIRTRTLTGQFL